METEEPTTPQPASDRARRQQVIAMSAIIVLLIGGISLAWWKFHTPTLDEPLVDVVRGPGAMFNRRLNFEPAAPVRRDGVRKTGAAASTNYEIHSGDALMRITQNKNSEWQFAGRYQKPKYTSPDSPKLLSVKYLSLTLGLTDDQRKQLDAIPAFTSTIVMSSDDQAKLRDQWKSYIAADEAGKTKLDPELTKLVAEIASRSEKASIEAADAHVAKIKAILTPAQLEQLNVR